MKAGKALIRIERTITIHRSVEDVFTYLSDVGHGPRYISGQREAHKTSAGPMCIGATFATTGKFLHRRATNEVTEYEPNRRFAWKSTSGARETTTWGFEPSGPSTRVTFTRVADATGLVRLAEPVMKGLANGRVDNDLGALKELLAVTRTPASTAKSW
jgi:uncharacterized protein YndB with AHSA1/START domain